MNRIALLVVAALAIAVPAATAAPAQKEASPTIATLAAKTPQLSTLLSLVKKAGLADELSAPGALTVFAPTNAAFAKVPKATLNALAKNPGRAEACPAVPRRRGQGDRGEGREAEVRQDPRRPVGAHPGHRHDRPDQRRTRHDRRRQGVERRRPRDRSRPDPARRLGRGAVAPPPRLTTAAAG